MAGALSAQDAGAATETWYVYPSGYGTLPTQILNLNLNCNYADDFILEFNLGAPPFTVALSEPLPEITCSKPVTIEARGSTLDGGGLLSTGCVGIRAVGTSLVVRDLNVTGFTYGGAYGLCGVMSVVGGKIYGNEIGALLDGGSTVKGAEIYQNNVYGISLNGPGTIGGSTLADRNLIYGNMAGIYLPAGGTVSGNYIGTKDGATAAANTHGIEGSGPVNITGNVISGNTFSAIGLVNASVGVIANNRIGTTADGSASLGNGSGIVVTSSSDNTFDGNVIAYNVGDGILLSSGAGNVISGGSIHSNGGKNINLDYALLPRPNDVPDGTIPGPNNGQNRPAIVSVVEDSGSTVIQGSLQSFAPGSVYVNDMPFNGQFEIDLYANDLPGVPAGKTWLGKVSATTDASGIGTFTRTIVGTGFGYVTATATGPFGTSEFSDTLQALVPAASITPMNVAFGNVVVGATVSTATEVAFRSNGTGDYMIDSISQGPSAPACPGTSSPVCATGDFSCSVSCTMGTPYPPLRSLTSPPSCRIYGLGFHPSLAGAQTTTLWICDNTSATARPITFTGTGMPHVVSVSQSAHDFGNVSVGTQVASPSILVTNASTNPPALLGPPTVAAPFSVGSNTCGSSLAPGASCNFTVVYAPTAVGPSTGTFSMTLANGNPVVVDLQGSGVPAPVGQLPLPAGIDFGTALLASAPLQHALTLQNTGNGPVNLGAITVTLPFQVSHNCPSSLAPSASCIVNLSFAPLVYGNTTGRLTVASDAGSGTQVVTLLATVAGTTYTLSPWDLSFGAVPVGSTSPSRTIALSNNGENTIPLSGFAVTGPYTIVGNGCGASLPPHSFCTAELAFAPVAAGVAEGTFSAQVGLEGAPPAVARLSGTGTQQPHLLLPGAIDFGSILRGSVPSASRPVELRNSGNATLTFTTSVSGPFALAGDCGASLAPSASCTLLITFAPSTVGEFAGSLDISSNAPGGSGAIPITARVQAQPRPDLRVDVSTMGFGDRMIGTPSTPQRVSVSNVGLVTAQLGVVPPTRDFTAASQCGATLAPGASCSVDVVFRPLAAGPRSGQLQFTSDAPASPYVVELLGTGCRPFTVLSRSGLRPACAP